MKLKRFLTVFMFLGLILTLVGCSEMGSVTKRFEKEGYTVEEIDKDELEEYQDEVDGLKMVYEVSDEDGESVAYIYEFTSAKALEDALTEDGEDIDDYEELINKNLMIITFNQDIIDIFQGK